MLKSRGRQAQRLPPSRPTEQVDTRGPNHRDARHAAIAMPSEHWVAPRASGSRQRSWCNRVTSPGERVVATARSSRRSEVGGEHPTSPGRVFAGIATPGPDETEATKFGWLGSVVTSRIRRLGNRRGHRVPSWGSAFGGCRRPHLASAHSKRPGCWNSRVQMGAEGGGGQPPPESEPSERRCHRHRPPPESERGRGRRHRHRNPQTRRRRADATPPESRDHAAGAGPERRRRPPSRPTRVVSPSSQAEACTTAHVSTGGAGRTGRAGSSRAPALRRARHTGPHARRGREEQERG